MLLETNGAIINRKETDGFFDFLGLILDSFVEAKQPKAMIDHNNVFVRRRFAAERNPVLGVR